MRALGTSRSKRASDGDWSRSVPRVAKIYQRRPTVSRDSVLQIGGVNPRKPYRTDLSDARWALIAPILTRWREQRAGLGIGQPLHDLREIVNAILYVNRTGMAWEYLPHDFPPYKTVYDYYAKWEADGTTEAIHDALRRRVRPAAGRAGEPTAAILDAQSVKT